MSSSRFLGCSSPASGSQKRTLPRTPLPESRSRTSKQPKEAGQVVRYKRIDVAWDPSKSIASMSMEHIKSMPPISAYDKCGFLVTTFCQADGTDATTLVFIRSQLLWQCLRDVMGQSNLATESLGIDPSLLFLYLEDFRKHMEHLGRTRSAHQETPEQVAALLRLNNKVGHVKALVEYLDSDFADVKKRLYPMLERGTITSDLLWALWRPDTLVYSKGQTDEQAEIVERVVPVDGLDKLPLDKSIQLRVHSLAFDGERFGYSARTLNYENFRGTREITSLQCYPLSYHRNGAALRQVLIERGKKLVGLHNSQHKDYDGWLNSTDPAARCHVLRSRIMVDTALFRRMNPDHKPPDITFMDSRTRPVSMLMEKAKGAFDIFSPDIREEVRGEFRRLIDAVVVSDPGPTATPTLDEILATERAAGLTVLSDEETAMHSLGEGIYDTSFLTDEDYLLAPSLIHGYSFSLKEWLNFNVSKIHDIEWNCNAWDSLVLPRETKDVIHGLVESRRENAVRPMDDVICGKEKGLVILLHGPPGTGKTLTAEAASEFFQCPLITTSARRLGTHASKVELELGRDSALCHAWGAIWLIEEADELWEQTTPQAPGTAVASTFMKHLDNFHGIVFLTTNHVKKVNAALRSRIDAAFRYDELDARAQEAVFDMFICRAKTLNLDNVTPFSNQDLNELAQHKLDGRQIKKAVASGVALASNRKEPFSMRHMELVLDIHDKFRRDALGGSEDAMNS